jgi:peptidoglycan-N-acetylglucosamine deacetylase
MKRSRMSIAAVLLAGVIGLTTPTAGAVSRRKAAGAEQPIGISSTTLTQNGQDLVWTVRFASPFSPSSLAAQHRAVCLLIERPANGSVRGHACLTGMGSRGAPGLAYAPITAAGPGAAQAITATITRSNSRELTASFLPTEVGSSYQTLRWQVISSLRTTACTPSHPGCYTLSPAAPTLLALHTPQLVGCVPSGASEVFDGSSKRREIALTFDDGPDTEPPSIDFVNLLAREHVPATFFEIGRQIPEYDPTGSLERAMLADGDMIGDHTWSHPDMTLLSVSEQKAELEMTIDAIRRRTGFTPCLWRPPYGDVDPQLLALARSMGMLTIMWDVDPRDWALPGTSNIYEAVVSAAHNGAIVIQHFGGGPRYETLAALPQEIATLRARGYTFVTVAQLLGLRMIYR